MKVWKTALGDVSQLGQFGAPGVEESNPEQSQLLATQKAEAIPSVLLPSYMYFSVCIDNSKQVYFYGHMYHISELSLLYIMHKVYRKKPRNY